MARRILVVVHGGRAAARRAAADAVSGLMTRGFEVLVDPQDDDAGEFVARGARQISGHDDELLREGCELALVFGGDGTLLRAAEMVHRAGIPLLGFNLGHVGFLAEAETDNLEHVLSCVDEQAYAVDSRLALQASLSRDGDSIWSTWALNEVSIERLHEPRVVELGLIIDGEPLSRYGCDGLVCATATGSTAHAFSAGGPVVWPAVETICVVPMSAHALFARPLLIAPTSVVQVEVLSTQGAGLWADGRRGTELAIGDVVTVARHPQDIRFARIHEAPFTRRLVAKFQLPVAGWRERGAES